MTGIGIPANKRSLYRGYFRLKSTRKKFVFHGIAVASVAFAATLFLSRVSVFQSEYLQINERDEWTDDKGLEESNCTPAAVDSFPSGFFSKEQRQQGAVVINFLVAFYIFGAIAIICDDYFVPSLEGITEGLNLAPDVAGATFMAAGSSAPELFTSMIGVFVTKGDIGMGTILGSAVFNLLFIIGLCGLLAGMVIQLVFWPMFRDSLYYVISITALVLTFYDYAIQWYESFIFILLYVGYILIMYYNESLEKCINRLFHINQNKGISERTVLTAEDSENNGKKSQSGLCLNVEYTNGMTIVHSSSNGAHHSNGTEPLTTTDEFVKEEKHVLAVPNGCIGRSIWLLALPIYLAFYLTVPDCRRERWKSWFMVTFLMSVLYIGGLSYILVWMVSIIGDTFDIPDTIMGLTLLAAGTSIPDAMASVLAARDGFGGMAISNSIGSNIFDILICLGMPWFVQTIFVDGTIEVLSTSLMFTSTMLLATVFLTVLIFYLRRGQLNTTTGFIFIISYFVFITICILNDLDIIGTSAGIVTCPST